MHTRRIVFLITAAFLALAVGAAWYWGQPRLLQVEPANGAAGVPAGAALRLTFNRPMEPQSVSSRLSIVPPQEGELTWEGSTLVFTPKTPWPSGQSIQARLSGGSRAAGLLPLTIPREASWSFTIRHPSLLYLYPSDGPANLYRIDPLSGETSQLTQGLGAVLDYSADPTGNMIYFNTSLGNGGSAIYSLDRLSGEALLLLECPDALCRYAQISPDGKTLAYERTSVAAGSPQVWLLPLTSDKPPQASGSPSLAAAANQRAQQPHWSPDGLLTYYNSSLAAFIVQDAQGRKIAQFLSQTGIPGSWHPDGEHYVIPEIYTNDIADPDLTDLETLPYSRLLEYSLEGAVRDLTGGDDVEDSSPAYAPNGEVLAFSRKFLDTQRWTPGRQLWQMKTDGTQASQTSQEPYYNHYDLAWSADSAQIAYVRFNKDSLLEPPEIWVVAPDGSSPRRLVSGGYSPRWIP
jgi:Tol biopolymer transport system component